MTPRTLLSSDGERIVVGDNFFKTRSTLTGTNLAAGASGLENDAEETPVPFPARDIITVRDVFPE
jgi:hypothetical protein